MSAQSNNQLASERREKNEVNQIKCQKQKLSKLQPENKPGFETRVLAVTVIKRLSQIHNRIVHVSFEPRPC